MMAAQYLGFILVSGLQDVQDNVSSDISISETIDEM